MTRRFCTRLGLAALLTALLPLAVSAEPAMQAKMVTPHLTRLGISRIGAPHVGAASMPQTRSLRDFGYRSTPLLRPSGHILDMLRSAHPDALSVPQVPGSPVEQRGPQFSGFNGLSHFDQRYAGTGIYANSQFSLEPPDQGLAVGNGFVLEMVNNALAVYKQDGTLVAGPTPTNQFFQLAPEFNRGSATGAPYGPSLSDVRCYYDGPSQRWFVEEWGTSVSPSGQALQDSFICLAVSQTSDPTGPYFLNYINTTGIAGDGNPVAPDFVQIGADANGFYFTSTNFILDSNGRLTSFDGASILAVSKAALIAGQAPPVYGFLGLFGYHIAPATTPPGDTYESAAGGTEYLASVPIADAFSSTGLGNHIRVYALSGTSSLDTAAVNLTLSPTLVKTQTFAEPPNAAQKTTGPTPLRDLLAEGDPYDMLATDTDALPQLVYADGRLWTANSTGVQAKAGGFHAGAAYYVLDPLTASNGTVTASVAQQGYVAAGANDLLYPTVGVNPSGQAAMTVTLSGQDYHPSAAYVNLSSGNSVIRIAQLGKLPDDGFTGYAAYGGRGVARWGDYSAAVADETGAIWLAAEFIPYNTGILTGSNPRGVLANWGTFVTRFQPTP